MMKEFEFRTLPGVGMLVLIFALSGFGVYAAVASRDSEHTVALLFLVAFLLLSILVLLCGFFIVGPNHTSVLTLFGKYKGL
jgi:hypothetical protein